MKRTNVIGAFLVCVGLSQSPSARANESLAARAPNPSTTQPGVGAPGRRWSIELGSGALVSNVRESHLDGYSLAPVELTLSRAFAKVYLDNFLGGIFEGSPEALVRGYNTVVMRGIESRLDGASFGLRYDFTKSGGRLTPFTETTVGLAFVDSRGITVNGRDRGLGQDFNFNFTVSAGLRYDLNERWFVRLAAVFSHYSNAGLSEPERENRQIDALGPVLSLGFRF